MAVLTENMVTSQVLESRVISPALWVAFNRSVSFGMESALTDVLMALKDSGVTLTAQRDAICVAHVLKPNIPSQTTTTRDASLHPVSIILSSYHSLVFCFC